MPRVSREHLDARRRHILESARRCFVRNGFHATSIQDVLGEAKVSAGAAYRYFPSKNALIEALADEAIERLREAFGGIFDADPTPPLHEALAVVCATIERLDEEHDVAKMAIQVWGEAARSPDLAARLSELIGAVRALITRLVETYQARGELGADVPAADIAPALMGLFPGFIMQHVIVGDLDAKRMATGLRGLFPPPRGDVPHHGGKRP